MAGVAWLAFRSPSTVGFFTSPSIDAAGLDRLKVGGGSFSWSWVDGSSGRVGILNLDWSRALDERDDGFGPWLVDVGLNGGDGSGELALNCRTSAPSWEATEAAAEEVKAT